MKRTQDFFSSIYMQCFAGHVIVPYSCDNYGCMRIMYWTIFELEIPHWNQWEKNPLGFVPLIPIGMKNCIKGFGGKLQYYQQSGSSILNNQSLKNQVVTSGTSWSLQTILQSSAANRNESLSFLFSAPEALVETYLMRTKEHALVKVFPHIARSLFIVFCLILLPHPECIYSFLITIISLSEWDTWSDRQNFSLSPSHQHPCLTTKEKEKKSYGLREQSCENFSFSFFNCRPCFRITDTSLPPHKQPWQYSMKHTTI